MSSFDLSSITGYQTIGSVPASSVGTTVTAAGSANTKGAWVELSSGIAADSNWIDVYLALASVAGKFLVDIGTGASGSESVLIANLHVDGASSSMGVMYRLPVNLPAGTRIAARCQSSNASATIRCLAILSQGDAGSLSAPGSIATYGADTSDSGLTAVNPGSTPHTDSAWVQLTASTSGPIRWLLVGIGHNAADSFQSQRTWLIDIATGAAASEVAIVSDILVTVSSGSSTGPNPRAMGFPVNIAAGTRLSARLRTSESVSTTPIMDIAIYGADADVPAVGGGGGGQHAHASWT